MGGSITISLASAKEDLPEQSFSVETDIYTLHTLFPVAFEELTDGQDIMTLWKEIKEGNGRAGPLRETFIKRFSPFVFMLARVYANRIREACAFDVDEDELVSVGMYEGVNKHIDSYDPNRNPNIVPFFRARISLRMKTELQRQDFVSRRDRSRYAHFGAIRKELSIELGYNATEQEIRDRMKLSDDESLTSFVPSHSSIFKSISSSSSEGVMTLADVLPDDRGEKYNQAIADLVELVLSNTYGIERKILELHYLQGMQIQEIAEVINMAKSQVSTCHVQALRKLWQKFSGHPDTPKSKHPIDN